MKTITFVKSLGQNIQKKPMTTELRKGYFPMVLSSCWKKSSSENQIADSRDALSIFLMFYIICHDLSEIRRTAI